MFLIQEEYQKSQVYQKTNYRFGFLSSLFSLVLTLAFLLFGGFEWADQLAQSFSSNEIIITLVFFGIITVGSDILTTPFSYYQTFVIEENSDLINLPKHFSSLTSSKDG